MLIQSASVVVSKYLKISTNFTVLQEEKLVLSYNWGFYFSYLKFSSAERALWFFHVSCNPKLFSKELLRSLKDSTYWGEQKLQEIKTIQGPFTQSPCRLHSPNQHYAVILLNPTYWLKADWYFFLTGFYISSSCVSHRSHFFTSRIWLLSKFACHNFNVSASCSIWHILSKKKRTTSVFLDL